MLQQASQDDYQPTCCPFSDNAKKYLSTKLHNQYTNKNSGTIYTCCLYGAVCNDFEAGNIHYKGHWKGWALEIETFLGTEIATSEASTIWAQKS